MSFTNFIAVLFPIYALIKKPFEGDDFNMVLFFLITAYVIAIANGTLVEINRIKEYKNRIKSEQ